MHQPRLHRRLSRAEAEVAATLLALNIASDAVHRPLAPIMPIARLPAPPEQHQFTLTIQDIAGGLIATTMVLDANDAKHANRLTSEIAVRNVNSDMRGVQRAAVLKDRRQSRRSTALNGSLKPAPRSACPHGLALYQP